MRVVDRTRLTGANLAPHEAFFVELWYGMTHSQSLDSYRVRCMNARTIAKELSEELRIGLIAKSGTRDELTLVCAEADKLLTNDPIAGKRYPSHLALLRTFLKRFGRPETKTDEKDQKQFRFVIDDLLAALQASYLRALCEALPEAIRPDNQDSIRDLTAALLSDLVDQGWDLSSLYRWHLHFLSGSKKRPYSFEQNLEFMLHQLQRDPQPFDVVLRLSGSERLAEIDQFGGFSMTESPKPAVSDEEGGRFAAPHPLVRFAQTEVRAVDYLPAALHARESFEEQLDLLRFDYEPRIVRIEDGCYVERKGDQKGKLLQVRLTVPNPVENTDLEGFDSFAKDVDRICNKSCIEGSSRVQLKAAIRQYRFGRDSASYRDMFLNWWMGLEALARVGEGRTIGCKVANNVSRVMAISCFFRLLRDLQVTLKYCKIGWSKELAELSQCLSVDDLTVSRLVSLLQSEDHAKILVSQCHSNPTLAYRAAWIGGWMRDPRKAAERFNGHLRNVECHLQRIYRIRCCIVHGSPVRHRLGLIAANLEFYLKQTILFALKAFHDNDHIANLEELYARASLATDRVLSALEAEGAGVAQIRDAVFARVVTTENRSP